MDYELKVVIDGKAIQPNDTALVRVVCVDDSAVPPQVKEDQPVSGGKITVKFQVPDQKTYAVTAEPEIGKWWVKDETQVQEIDGKGEDVNFKAMKLNDRPPASNRNAKTEVDMLRVTLDLCQQELDALPSSPTIVQVNELQAQIKRRIDALV